MKEAWPQVRRISGMISFEPDKGRGAAADIEARPDAFVGLGLRPVAR
jgi:hypothetical protein